MKEFLSAAFPLVLAGIALAVLAASCGLWENHAVGLALGPLWGMALGAICKGTQPQ